MDRRLEFRFAEEEDSELLFSWRNDPLTRSMSFNSDLVTWETHDSWFKNSLENPLRKIYIFTCDGLKVGMGRIDLVDGVSELSWSIAPDARGKGFGSKMVKVLFENADPPRRAFVKKDNIASSKIALNAGFTLHSTKDGLIEYIG